MRKLFSVAVVALVSGMLWPAPVVRAEGGPIVGTELGAMIPRGSLDAYVDTGGVISPFGGYMFNDYIGLWGHIQAWGANSKDRPGKDDNVTWVGAVTGGPRFVFPLGSIRLWGTFEFGIFTGLTDEAVTDTSWGFSTGAGLDFPIIEGLYLGAFGRWNRAYQRVHSTHDVKYITTGI